MPVRYGYESFPDEVWCRLKAWAKIQAGGEASPTPDECALYVRTVVKDLTGDAGALRPDVVCFYAAETSEMVARFRQQFLADLHTILPAADRSLESSLDGTPQ